MMMMRENTHESRCCDDAWKQNKKIEPKHAQAGEGPPIRARERGGDRPRQVRRLFSVRGPSYGAVGLDSPWTCTPDDRWRQAWCRSRVDRQGTQKTAQNFVQGCERRGSDGNELGGQLRSRNTCDAQAGKACTRKALRSEEPICAHQKRKVPQRALSCETPKNA